MAVKGSNKEDKSSNSVVSKPSLSSDYTLMTIFAALIVAVFTYQTTVVSQVFTKLDYMDSRISLLHESIRTLAKNPDSANSVGTTEEAPKPVAVDGVYDLEGHEPHAHYLKNIPTSPNDSRIPADLDREYTYEDFETMFEVTPLHQVLVLDEVKELLEGHDVTQDEYYKNWEKTVNRLAYKYRNELAMDSLEELDREKMAVKWISLKTGFGVVAKRPIKKGEVVGRYTGTIGFEGDNTDYVSMN
jgi:hypothetical protein